MKVSDSVVGNRDKKKSRLVSDATWRGFCQKCGSLHLINQLDQVNDLYEANPDQYLGIVENRRTVMNCMPVELSKKLQV